MAGPGESAAFVVRAAAIAVGAFGFFALEWTATHLLLPITLAQARVAERLFGAASFPVEVTLACSGTDAIALCLSATLAYPVPPRRRLTGALTGVALILFLNITRIGTLGQAPSPAWFSAMHLYAWPIILTVAIASYLLVWMRANDQASPAILPEREPLDIRRFAALALLFVAAGAVAAHWLADSPIMAAAAGLVARGSAVILTAIGVHAHTVSNVMWTARGGFAVTAECLSTPLVPVYLAAVCAWLPTWRARAAGLAAAVPLFAALAVLRLLAAAFPGAATPAFLVHAFYQLLLAAVVVVVAAWWRHGGRATAGPALAGAIGGLLVALFLGPAYLTAIAPLMPRPMDDPQGALALLPAFQLGLYVAVSIAAFAVAGWPRLLIGLAVLAATHATGLVIVQAMHGAGLWLPVAAVRAWAVGAPLFILAGVATRARTAR